MREGGGDRQFTLRWKIGCGSRASAAHAETERKAEPIINY
jgi:hypothetical protein